MGKGNNTENLLGQTVASRCENSPALQRLTPSPIFRVLLMTWCPAVQCMHLYPAGIQGWVRANPVSGQSQEIIELGLGCLLMDVQIVLLFWLSGAMLGLTRIQSFCWSFCNIIVSLVLDVGGCLGQSVCFLKLNFMS